MNPSTSTSDLSAGILIVKVGLLSERGRSVAGMGVIFQSNHSPLFFVFFTASRFGPEHCAPFTNWSGALFGSRQRLAQALKRRDESAGQRAVNAERIAVTGTHPAFATKQLRVLARRLSSQRPADNECDE
jgi:hypothetical protein